MLDALHVQLRQSPLLNRFTAFTRVLLAIGFIPPGLVKLLGVPFTTLPTTTPVGYFFDAFFQAGEFYAFVGLAQIIAGVLLLFPSTATLGAVMYFPIILNITIVTIAIGFQGTWLITLLMTLGCLYLLCWDYDRLRPLLPARRPRAGRFGAGEYVLQMSIWATIGIVVFGGAALTGIANLWENFGFTGFAVAALVGSAFGLVVAWHLRAMPRCDNSPAPVRSSVDSTALPTA